MNTCTFFGHKNTPDSVAPALKKAIINLIEQEDVACFYVGSQGKFDMMTIRILKEIKHLYPHVAFAIVISKLPSQKRKK